MFYNLGMKQINVMFLSPTVCDRVPSWFMGYGTGEFIYILSVCTVSGTHLMRELDGGFFVNGFSTVTLKARTSSKGFVRLTGSHPQDVLEIQKNHFQPVDSPDIQRDLAALRGGIRTARQIVQLPHIAEHILEEVNPGPSVQTDEEMNQYIFKRIFCEYR